jgi:hypothetical protein
MPPKHLALVALSRSGHHAVMNWLLAQMGDVWELGPIGLADMALRQWDGERLVDRVKTKDMEALPLEPTKWFLRSFENTYVGKVKRTVDSPIVLVIRDLKNWLASLWQWHENMGFRWDEEQTAYYLSVWKDHAVWTLFGNGEGIITIRYDKWVQDMEYRKYKSVALGIHTLEAFVRGEEAKTKVATAGGGSSFDYQATDAVDLDVFNRWEDVDDRAALAEVLRLHPDAVLLDKELFG